MHVLVLNHDFLSVTATQLTIHATATTSVKEGSTTGHNIPLLTTTTISSSVKEGETINADHTHKETFIDILIVSLVFALVLLFIFTQVSLCIIIIIICKRTRMKSLHSTER